MFKNNTNNSVRKEDLRADFKQLNTQAIEGFCMALALPLDTKGFLPKYLNFYEVLFEAGIEELAERKAKEKEAK